jgi:hypothetical protein
VRWETGKEQEVQVLHDDDVASHIAPSRASCSVRGQTKRRRRIKAKLAIAPRKRLFPSADRVINLEGNTARRVIASGGSA